MLAKLLPKEEVDRQFGKITAALREALLPFQVDGVRRALEIGGRILIGDEMGLGKTVQAIAVALAYREEWPLLVVCPAGLKHQWQSELTRWGYLNKSEVKALEQREFKNPKPRGVQAVVIGYTTASKFFGSAYCGDWRPRIIVCDESHSMKNPQTAICKALLPQLKSAGRVVLLSGTAAANRPVELQTQLEALNPTFFSNRGKEFEKRYCDRKDTHFGVDNKGASNLQELHSILTHTKRGIMVRRLKKDVLEQLPKKHRTRVALTLQPGV